MKRLITWFLFETVLGDRLIGLAERVLGVGVLPVGMIDDSVDELVDELLDKAQLNA